MRFFDASLPSQSLSITEEIIDPAVVLGQRKTYRIYISRYTASGRRRSDLEMLLLKAIKILKLLGDRFSHMEKASQNPIHQSASWKIDRLQESISILNTHGIDTMEELNQRLQAIGARHSHAKKEAAFLSESGTALQTLKDSLLNLPYPLNSFSLQKASICWLIMENIPWNLYHPKEMTAKYLPLRQRN